MFGQSFFQCHLFGITMGANVVEYLIQVEDAVTIVGGSGLPKPTIPDDFDLRHEATAMNGMEVLTRINHTLFIVAKYIS